MHGIQLRIFAVFLVAFANDLRPMISIRDTVDSVSRAPVTVSRDVSSGLEGFRKDLKTIVRQVRNLLTQNPR
jgi:hypothetical protein